MRLSEVWIYPVKALHGLSVGAAAVHPWGLDGDRRWMVVKEDGRFLTQRAVAGMARVHTRLEGGALTLLSEGRVPCHVVEPPAHAPTLRVTVWSDVVEARCADEHADRWLAGVLGQPCRLVFMADPEQDRTVDPDYATPADRVSFADGFPLLLASTGSLEDLNGRMDLPVPMTRFRPNLVVDAAEPWQEDGWHRIRVGAVEFDLVKPCARCIVTTIDQDSGEASDSREPIRALQRFRRDRKGQVLFGQNLIPRSTGHVSVGDPVVILD